MESRSAVHLEGDRSAISDELIDAYLSTEYRVGSGPEGFTLCIGERSPRLVELYATHACRCAAFITAWNPRSERASDEENAAAHRRLCERLTQRAIAFIDGAGVDPERGWREQSALALGLAVEDAKALGCEFDQNAIVWSGADAVPHLYLLR